MSVGPPNRACAEPGRDAMPTATRGEPPVFTNAGRRFPPEVLTDAEARALMDACGEGLPSCARNRALIAVLYRGGLRVSEALALYPKDLDAASGAGRLAVVFDDDGVPAGAGCPRCRRVTIMRIEEITREAWDGQQARRTHRTA